MEFERNVKFLSMTENKLSDGGVYYAVGFFDPETNSALTINVMSNAQNADNLTLLRGYLFGDTVAATFRLVPRDKLYKLSLVRVS